MAKVRPFRAIRFNPSKIPEIGDVLAPPFDVITTADNKVLQEKHPHNIVRLELGERENVETNESNVYIRSANQLFEWQDQGILIREKTPAFYLVKEKYGGTKNAKERIGIFAAVQLEEFANKVVLPHEQTAEGPKKDRFQLMTTCEASFSPVFGLYRDEKGLIENLLEYGNAHPPAFTAKTGTANYEAWVIEEEHFCNQIEDSFKDAQIFIADGHHRYETALAYRDSVQNPTGAPEKTTPQSASEFVLMCLVELSDPGMQLLSLHRVIPKLSLKSRKEIWNRIETIFSVESTSFSPSYDGINQWLDSNNKEQSPQMVIGVLDNQTKTIYSLCLHSPLADNLLPSPKIPEFSQCNTWVLQNGILDPILGEDISKVGFVHEPKDVDEAVGNKEVEMIFLVSPIAMDLFETIVSHGERLPRKSTYFLPKLATGLFMYSLKDDL